MYRAVVVGTGVGGMHCEVLTAMPDFDVVGIVHHGGVERAEKLAAAAGGATVTTDMAEAASGGVDLVVIATPPSTRLDLVRQAVALGPAALLCEKPLAFDTSSADAIAALAREAQILDVVDFQWRFNPVLEGLQKNIAAGALGRLQQLDVCWRLPFMAGTSTDWPWRHDPSIAVAGVMADMGVHVFDLVAWLSGTEFNLLAAAEGPRNEREDASGPIPAGTEDVAQVLLSGKDAPVIASCFLSRTCRGKFQMTIAVTGEDGRAYVTIDNATGAARVDYEVEGDPAGPLEADGGTESMALYSALEVSLGGGTAELPRSADGVAAQRILNGAVDYLNSRRAGD